MSKIMGPFFFCVCLSLFGCVLSNPTPRNTRYKIDISSMEKTSFLHDSWIYRHPTKRAVDYRKFVIAPISVYENTADKIKDHTPYTALSQVLTARTRALMERDYVFVEQPGEGILRIEISVVDIKPVVRINKGVTDSIIINSPIKGTKLDMDCFDSVTNEEIFAISTLYKGDEYLAHRDPLLIKNVEAAFDEWIKFLKVKFDEAMAKTAAPAPPAH